MSKLDLALQEKVLRETGELYKDLEKLDEKFLAQEGVNRSSEKKPDINEWLEVFAQDEVRVEGCR